MKLSFHFLDQTVRHKLYFQRFNINFLQQWRFHLIYNKFMLMRRSKNADTSKDDGNLACHIWSAPKVTKDITWSDFTWRDHAELYLLSFPRSHLDSERSTSGLQLKKTMKTCSWLALAWGIQVPLKLKRHDCNSEHFSKSDFKDWLVWKHYLYTNIVCKIEQMKITNERTNGQKNKQINEQTDKQMNKRVADWVTDCSVCLVGGLCNPCL